MKKIMSFLLAFALCLTAGFSLLQNAAEVSAASSHVYMIVTNPGENCNDRMNINFHADLGYTNCYVQYTLKNDVSWANAKTQTGTYVTYGANATTNPFYNKSSKNANGVDYTQTKTFLDYSVTLSGLTRSTEYMYRIYDGSSAYSAVYCFKTSGSDSWSFVVTGDIHEYYENYGVDRAGNATKAVNAGISLASQLSLPTVEHVVAIGDIVAWGVAYDQWQLIYNQPYIKNYAFANTVGNHDAMDRSAAYTNKYHAITANYPSNGYSGQEGACYYYLFNNVLFINASYLDTSAASRTWAASAVNSLKGQYKYIVLVNHRPATSKYNGKTYSYFWNYWMSFCDTYKVDLVLAGDHHVYMRTPALRNNSALTNYSASNPDGTVYLAADSADGERGSSLKDSSPPVTSWSYYVAQHYFRQEISNTTKDITSILVTVENDRLTTRLVYFENQLSGSASAPFYQGSVTGHSSFYYGDTSYVYPSNHNYVGNTAGGGDIPGPDPDEPVLPAATTNFAAASGAQYKYSTSVYPGSASYYTYAYYGDNSSQGGSFMTGKLNDGIIPADSSPGTSNVNWAVFFKAQGAPVVYLKLSEAAYINNISVYYYLNIGSYCGEASISSVEVSSSDSGYTPISSYTTSVTNYSGNIYKLTLTFNAAVNASYISLNFGVPTDTTRMAVGEIQVWGDTTLPEAGSFALIDETTYTLDDTYVTLNAPLVTISDVKAQFKCSVVLVDGNGDPLADVAVAGTGCVVRRLNNSGEIINSVTIVVPGDMSGDGLVNMTDYITIKLSLKGSSTLSGAYRKAADVDHDGSVATADYLRIKQHCRGTNLIGG